jgi:D-alanine-D-alanine ligase
MKAISYIDVAVIAMHGMHGEDGTLQGLFELADLPYTSAGITGSAAGMDKIVMKAAFKGLGIPALDCVYFERIEYIKDRETVLAKIEGAFSYPVIVKPANLGSSIGISRAIDRESLVAGIDVAVHYDRRVLVERAISDLTEINCAVLGEGADAVTSLLEQPVTAKAVLDFSEKYLKGGVGKGMKSLDRILPAKLSKEMEEKIRQYSLEIFKGFDMKGVVRIDYMIDDTDGSLYVNEVNTIPGSMAFYLFEPAGIPYKTLIDRLVDVALRRYKEKFETNFAFDSEILKKIGGAKTGIK